MQLNINSDAAVTHTNRLEKFSRSALPNAIRATLNSAAFDVKKNTMPESAAEEFTLRAPSFFKANSRVEMAKGFNVDDMKATVGFVPKGGPGSDHAVEELEQQEYGGEIDARSFIAMDTARIGGSNDKRVRPVSRLGSIKKIYNSNTMEGKTPKAKFIHAANKAGVGGYVIGNNTKKILYRVVALGGDFNGSVKSGTTVKLQPLFSFDQGRSVTVKETGFMRSASMESAGRLDEYFVNEATKQLEKIK